MLTITHENLGECDRASHGLRDHLDELARMTETYPVECTFASYRFVFRNRGDIEKLIAMLDEKLATFRQKAA